MSEELDFHPLPFFKKSFHQTVMGSFPSIYKDPPSHTCFVLLPDKDYIAMEITTPDKWKKTDPTVFFIHGLCGSHRSSGLVRLTKKLRKKKIRAIRINLRGCGSGKGKARKLYHGGQSDDIFYAIKKIHSETPDSKMFLVGFSLGANISLKLSAEISIANMKMLHKTIAINPPVDLYSSIKLLGKKENRIYERYFIKLLREDIEYRQKIFRDIAEIKFPDSMSFMEFDNLYTAPVYGFKNNLDYYKRSSSKYLISAIDFKCNILFSEDDPIIKIHSFDRIVLPKNVKLFRTKKGGHIGYITMPTINQSIHWIDNIILQWIFEDL